MKVIFFISLLFLSAIIAPGQSLPAASVKSSLTVLQKGWRFEIYNPALDVDPFEANNEQQQLKNDRQRTAEINRNRAIAKLPPVSVPYRIPPLKETSRRDASVSYIYTVKLRNEGEKEIRGLIWEYVFFEPVTEKEVGRRQFLTDVKIKPGKTQNLIMRSAAPPTETIGASRKTGKLREKFSEKIVIRAIEFADGSLWVADDKTAKK